MGKNRIIYLLFSLFISIMNANAQTCSLEQLQAHIWYAKSGYSLEPLCDWNISFVGKKCRYTYTPKERKDRNTPNIVIKKMDYYLCDSRPFEFVKNQWSEQGNYIAFRQVLTYNKKKKSVFWYAKIKSVNSKVLILEMDNETITFESHKD